MNKKEVKGGTVVQNKKGIQSTGKLILLNIRIFSRIASADNVYFLTFVF